MAYNRYLALVSLMGFFCLLYASFSKTAGRRANLILISMCILACCIGVAATGYFILRAEILIFRPVFLSLFALSDDRGSAPYFQLSILIILVFMMALYAHPKSLYFLADDLRRALSHYHSSPLGLVDSRYVSFDLSRI